MIFLPSHDIIWNSYVFLKKLSIKNSHSKQSYFKENTINMVKIRSYVMWHKILDSNWFRLKFPKVVVGLAKLFNGGQGIHRLIALIFQKRGYTQFWCWRKPFPHQCYIWFIEFQHRHGNKINKLQILGDDDEEEWERKTYMKLVLANQFRENNNLCFEESC